MGSGSDEEAQAGGREARGRELGQGQVDRNGDEEKGAEEEQHTVWIPYCISPTFHAVMQTHTRVNVLPRSLQLPSPRRHSYVVASNTQILDTSIGVITAPQPPKNTYRAVASGGMV